MATAAPACRPESLFDLAALGPRAAVGIAAELDGRLERIELGRGAWLELGRDWVSGHEALLEALLTIVPWARERRVMYDRLVEVPRLVCHYGGGDELPHPVLGALRTALNDRYERQLGEPLRTVGLCCYRDGRDSVAWHGDRLGRGATEDTVVAIVSLGARRRLLLRPARGGTSLRFELGAGDLFVMGGTCQRTFDHAVPKTARTVRPRISIQFRARGVG
ncbi:MAG TPA: alpha-ketoglutarate-dependent dioxygenase AlkB [Acidimicrobiales bacterium]|nr:alpha-ketoglutarate-dependent dioxygenase AlkB [Acidimicrobiales bacterium]